MMKQLLWAGFWVAGIVSALIAQPVRAEVVQVTGVQLKPTAQGVEVILETKAGRATQVFTTRYGEILIADITNSRLALPSGNTFRQDNPVKGRRCTIGV